MEDSYIVHLRKSLKEENRHMPILQDGAAIILVNEKGEILLQSRADRDLWGLPGGCQELSETFEETIIREVKEETNLTVKQEDLQLIAVVSGNSRYNTYPNGDQVYNNTVLYMTNQYQGDLQYDVESKDMQFFNLENLPKNLMDIDLIQQYRAFLTKTNGQKCIEEGYCLITTACDTKETAQRIIDSLIKKRLASCVQAINVQSTYYWNKAIEQTNEIALHIKTKKSLYEAVEKEINTLHDYTLPEVASYDMIAGSKEFFHWIDTETR